MSSTNIKSQETADIILTNSEQFLNVPLILAIYLYGTK
ncbi:hypothetical protein ABIB40_002875 [Pedobacter sp. UYP30]